MTNKLEIIIYTCLIICTILLLAWGSFVIVPLQIEYTDNCKNICSEQNLNYSVSFSSNPWDNVNGKCFCKLEYHQELEEAQE